ncbi:MAG: phosphotransferase [Actinomycetota bacterium]|nr:phosphotransferase [Actinomycetota bacterium]
MSQLAEPGHLDALFDQIESLADKPRTVEELSGGLTNLNLKVTTPRGVFVARCSRSDTTLLGIDREAEHANTLAAEQAGVGAPFVEFRPDLGVLVIGYIEGHTYDNADMRKPGALARVAEACRTLHAGPRFVGDFNMFSRQRTYLNTVESRGFRFPDAYGEFDQQFRQIESVLALKAGPTVPCNNDLLAGNLVDDGQKLWLIDYEYSGNNDPYFELGNTWTECRLDLDHLDELVTAYVGRHAPDKIARTRLQSIVSQYGWSLWGFIQAATNDFDFDFYGWGLERFEGAVEEFRSPEFPRLIEAAQ